MNGLAIGLMLPFAGTALGAACVFLMRREMPQLLQKKTHRVRRRCYGRRLCVVSAYTLYGK